MAREGGVSAAGVQPTAAVLDGLSEAIACCDESGVVRYANAAAVAVFGQVGEVLRGPPLRPAFERVARTGEAQEIDAWASPAGRSYAVRMFTVDGRVWMTAREREVDARVALGVAGEQVDTLLERVAQHVGKGLGDACAIRWQASDGTGVVARWDVDDGGARGAPAGSTGPMEPVRADGADARRIATAVGLHDDTDAREVHSLIAAPLRADDRVLGAIAVARRNPTAPPYGAAELTTLEAIAERVALVLHHRETVDRLQAEVQRAVASRDDFIYVASHELRSPLNGLVLQLDALRDMAEESPEALPQRAPLFVQRLMRHVDRIMELLDRLLVVSRIAGGRLRLEPRDMELVELVRTVVARFDESARRAGGSIEVTAPAAVPGRWDPAALDQVLASLVGNAVKYGGGKPIAVEIEAEDGQARVRVRDGGIGIAPGDVGRVFEAFQRVASANAAPGLGLGLYVARAIAEAHGGTVEVASEAGAGSTFTLALPRG